MDVFQDINWDVFGQELGLEEATFDVGEGVLVLVFEGRLAQ